MLLALRGHLIMMKMVDGLRDNKKNNSFNLTCTLSQFVSLPPLVPAQNALIRHTLNIYFYIFRRKPNEKYYVPSEITWLLKMLWVTKYLEKISVFFLVKIN